MEVISTWDHYKQQRIVRYVESLWYTNIWGDQGAHTVFIYTYWWAVEAAMVLPLLWSLWPSWRHNKVLMSCRYTACTSSCVNKTHSCRLKWAIIKTGDFDDLFLGILALGTFLLEIDTHLEASLLLGDFCNTFIAFFMFYSDFT